jgi:hypothetical protein
VREFQHFDRDGNAQVTLDEYKGPMAAMVTNMDRNGDGVLSRDDRRQRGDRMRQGRDRGMNQAPAENDDAEPAAPPAPANP